MQTLIKNSVNASKLKIGEGSIQFQNVSMRYKNGPMVLNNVNLNVKGKSKVALVGSSGGGKTTIFIGIR